MEFFNLHHHFPEIQNGLYNLEAEETDPGVSFSVGLHPKDIVADWSQQWEAVQKKSLHPQCKAIGECGLDGLIAVSEKVQKEVFREHVLWANEVQKPVIIHCVKRFSDLIAFKKMAKIPMIIHGFNKKKAVAEEMLKNGFYLSFGNSLCYSVSLQDVFLQIPQEKIFLETDTAETDLEKIYQKAAAIKGITVEQLLGIIRENRASTGLL